MNHNAQSPPTTSDLPAREPQLLEDVDVRYGPDTVPQGPLPFHVRVRRLHRWWPGPERYGKAIDRTLLVAALSPGIIWASISFGWPPVLFTIVEVVLVWLTIYRVLSGTFLD
jgi:hypothetical protein